jgi:hypothetical protein
MEKKKKSSPTKETNTNGTKADDIYVKKSIEERVAESKSRKGLHGRTKTADTTAREKNKNVMLEHSSNGPKASVQVPTERDNRVRMLSSSQASGTRMPKVQPLDLSKTRTNDASM